MNSPQQEVWKRECPPLKKVIYSLNKPDTLLLNRKLFPGFFPTSRIYNSSCIEIPLMKMAVAAIAIIAAKIGLSICQAPGHASRCPLSF